ncbi:MAG: LysM domain-containing protein [Betaproteobacteria bacterium]|nr:LysM domain-containing protein [Betaproteobacteria bacterium]
MLVTAHAAVDSLVRATVIAALIGAIAAPPLAAQTAPVTPQQQAVAKRTATAGLPLNELKAGAPERYTVKPGDTLWGLSAAFLTQPWRWPELWGMNLQDIRNPHLIYPGQVLLLDKQDGRATLRLAAPVIETPAEGPTIKLSPRIRVETPADAALPALKSSMIDAFLTEPVVVDDSSLQTAARIVAAQDSRVLLTRGDRAYALGGRGSPLTDDPRQPQQAFRVLRNATPLKDPVSGEVLGFEAQYIGRVLLVRGESVQTTTSADGKAVQEVIPATIDIVAAREEIRVGDRLLPEPALTLRSYVPRAPSAAMEARVVSVYGNAVANVGQNQVVVINRGSREGLESGHMLAILTDGARLIDKTDLARTALKLPDERKGLLMVFRAFERLSYALVLEATEGVRVGDRLVNPR